MAVLWLTGVAGCILPVSPEFQDPEPNVSPYVVNALPAIGSIVRENDEIAVTLADPNPGDQLSLRWLFNYPPFSATSRLSLPEVLPPSIGGGEVRTRVARIKPTCFRDVVGGPQHRVMLLVSDRGFDEPTSVELPFDNVPKDARVLRISWVLQKVCQ